jgi:pentatricopeptide repeat protein
MNSLGIRPKDFTLASVLACCAAECLDLRGAQAAQQLHGHIVYGKCLSLTDARRAFDDILQPNDVSWNIIIRRYRLAGMGDMAVHMFFMMLRAGVRRPLVYTVAHAMLACRDSCALKEGKCIHSLVLCSGEGMTTTTYMCGALL